MDADKYQNKYRIASARLASWDYGSNAAYFITICVQDRSHAFGEVVDGRMNLTLLGEAAWECWRAIPEHFPFVVLGEFVAMPNHVHGTIIIDKRLPNADADPIIAVETQDVVETQDFASLRRPARPQNQFGPQSQNLASIVRGFKIGVTKFARQRQIAFAWQARYYDHIIRNAAEHERIRKYIVENPQKWADDQFH
jgi:REP element-mobilizing transposase RayT